MCDYVTRHDHAQVQRYENGDFYTYDVVLLGQSAANVGGGDGDM